MLVYFNPNKIEKKEAGRVFSAAVMDLVRRFAARSKDPIRNDGTMDYSYLFLFYFDSRSWQGYR